LGELLDLPLRSRTVLILEMFDDGWPWAGSERSGNLGCAIPTAPLFCRNGRQSVTCHHFPEDTLNYFKISRIKGK
jgi:hypothetical protein